MYFSKDFLTPMTFQANFFTIKFVIENTNGFMFK